MIELKNVTKKYGDKTVYDDFNLSLDSGRITAVLGESGSGKTTLLNMIGGLTDYEGEVTGVSKPVSFVFQRDMLVRNLTVGENVRLVAENSDVESALEQFGLAGAADKYPEQLSAGMARRVAIIRAFAFPSDTVLMDEPFVNLDVALKYYLTEKVKRAVKSAGKTAVIVTHDVKEAVSVADRIIVLSRGKIVSDVREITEETENFLFNVMLNLNKY